MYDGFWKQVTACGACPLPFYLRGRAGAAIKVPEAASEIRRSFSSLQCELDRYSRRRGSNVGGGGCGQPGIITGGQSAVSVAALNTQARAESLPRFNHVSLEGG